MSKKIHFLAIGGVAMANLAVMFKKKGYQITGSDEKIFPPMSNYLEKNNIIVKEPYQEKNLKNKPDLVVVGNSISRGNPEIEFILREKIQFISMPELIKEHFIKDNLPIVVTGTHGKTTTSSLIAYLLDKLEVDTGFFIGGASDNFKNYGRDTKQKGGYFVIEGDEYDSAFFDKKCKFFHYFPQYLIINNIEFDHADIFRDVTEIVQSFKYLTRLVPQNGWILANADDKNSIEAIKNIHTKAITFGYSKKADYIIQNIINIPYQQTMLFSLLYKKTNSLLDFKIPLLGNFNVFNATAAIITCLELGLDIKKIKKHLLLFKNVKKRLELKTNQKNVLVFDDFAHHPTAIKKTINSVKKTFPAYYLLVVYEPKSNTSISNIHQDCMAQSFNSSDGVFFFKNNKFKNKDSSVRINIEKIEIQLQKLNKKVFSFTDIKKLKETLLAELKNKTIILFLIQSDLNGLPIEIGKIADKKWR